MWKLLNSYIFNKQGIMGLVCWQLHCVQQEYRRNQVRNIVHDLLSSKISSNLIYFFKIIITWTSTGFWNNNPPKWATITLQIYQNSRFILEIIKDIGPFMSLPHFNFRQLQDLQLFSQWYERRNVFMSTSYFWMLWRENISIIFVTANQKALS